MITLVYSECTGGKFFGNANYTWDPLSYYNIGEVQQLECIEGYQYLSGERNQNITCSVEGWNTTGLKKCVPMCKGELSYGNANLSSDSSIYYKIGETEDLVCDEAYQYLSGKDNQTVTCTSEGWNRTDLEKCVKKCTGSVSYGNANSTWTSSNYYKIGFVGELKCNEDYQYLGGKKTQNITCTETGWRTEGLDKCGEKCKGEVTTYGNANSTWDTSKSYEIGSIGELECFDGSYLSGGRKQNIYMFCRGWNKTGLESCFKMCTGALHYGNANSTWKANDYYPIGDIQTIECNEGYQYLWNSTKQNVTCTKDGWDKSNLENCVEMCDSNVTLKQNIKPLSSTKKYYKIGEEAKVECKSGYEYAYKKTIQTIECTEEGWDLSSLQKCSTTCDDEPPPKGNHVAPLNITSRGVGDTISYKCQSGHFEPL
ncbi:Complement factor H-related protein 4, partial [Armadillidium vulgare]